MRQAAANKAIYGLWLDQKAKILADSFVLPDGGGGFWVGSYFSSASQIRSRLEQYIIADDVAVEDATEGWEAVSLVGEGAGAWLSALKEREGVIFPGRRAAAGSWEWVFPVAAREAVAAALSGLRAVDAGAMERLRIEAGIPAVPMDAGPGDMPAEAGLDEIAVSATKGCYLGQEIVARLKSRGAARRRLCRVRADGAPPPSLPAPLLRREQRAGDLRSAALNREGTGFAGLAMIALRGLQEGETLHLPSGQGVVVVH